MAFLLQSIKGYSPFTKPTQNGTVVGVAILWPLNANSTANGSLDRPIDAVVAVDRLKLR